MLYLLKHVLSVLLVSGLLSENLNLLLNRVSKNSGPGIAVCI